MADPESFESLSRLEIHDKHLLDFNSRVSKEQVTALEKAIEQLNQIKTKRIARSKRLGISDLES